MGNNPGLFEGIIADKGNVRPRIGHEGPEGDQKNRSTFSLTSAHVGVSGQRHAQDALPPGIESVPNVEDNGWFPVPVWTVQKISPLPRLDPRTIQPLPIQSKNFKPVASEHKLTL